MQPDGPEKIVFVGGAPRSGTTVVHALICTSHAVGDYNPEISFFRGFVTAYRLGRLSWDGHTNAFFDAPDDFRALVREACDLAIRRFWDVLGRPAILALKDPLLTPLFPELQQLYPEALFVAVTRDPVAVARSRQAVKEKASPGQPFSEADALNVGREYAACYRAVLGHDYQGRMFLLRYESLNEPQVQADLARFIGVDDLDPARLWGGKPDPQPNDAWSSPKYHKAIDLEPRLSPLADNLAAKVREGAAAVLPRLGYGEDRATAT
jgi:hypothetical protein